MKTGKVVRVGFLAVLLASTGALFVRVLLTTGAPTGACGAVPPAHGLVPGGVLAAVAGGSFIVGGLVGAWRTAAAGSRESEPGDVAVHAVLVLLLVVVVAALAYETFALASTSVWPITFYIRCANYVAPWWTLLGLASVCGLLGHWLWQPVGGR